MSPLFELRIIFKAFDLISFLATVLLVLGLINPHWVPQFTKQEKTRKRSLIIYGPVVAISFFIMHFVNQQIIGTGSKNPASKESPQEIANVPLPKCLDPLKSPTKRSVKDLPDDDTKNKQFHILYVLPKDGEDQNMDTNGRIATSISALQNWICNQTGGQYFRFDTYQGNLDITYVKLPLSDSEVIVAKDLKEKRKYLSDNSLREEPIMLEVGSRLISLGFRPTNKIYLVFYGGTGPKDKCGQSPINSPFAFAYLRPSLPGGGDCGLDSWTSDYLNPQEYDFTIGHELLHAIGFIPGCSPHQAGFHVIDKNSDIMFGIEDDPQNRDSIKGSQTVLDFNRDDYYGSNIPGCPDLKKSAFLSGGGNELPTGMK